MITNIHFVGIKGVGMAALAVLLKEAGIEVTGSDIGEQFITDVPLLKVGIIPLVGFSSEHVNNAQLVITTGAHKGYDNPEVISAKEKGIRVISLAEAIGMVMDGSLLGRRLTGISVAGTHGKTTTTALIATIFKSTDLDPSYFIGTSYIPSLGNSGHYGEGEYFVVESDEYAIEPNYDKRPKFFLQFPKIAVFTNIELDHPDIYPDVDSVRNVFLQFAKQINPNGVLIANGDDPQIKLLLDEYKGRVITYGLSPENNYVVSDIQVTGGSTSFYVSADGRDVGSVIIRIHGSHNCLNAMAAIIVGLEAGLTFDAIRYALLEFTGTVRRLEYKGVLASGALYYDDYAHHPTEIKKTLSALRSLYGDKQIVCIFQPHTYSRTKALFEDFLRSFDDAAKVIITEIYASAREDSEEIDVSGEGLVDSLRNVHNDVLFLPLLSDVVEYLNKSALGSESVVVTMGAGNIYRIEDLVDK